METLYRKTKSKPGGFTLIELILTMALISILVLIATPYARDWQTAQKANNVAIALVTLLHEAKMLSIERNFRVIVAFDTDTHVVSVYLDTDADGIQLYDLQKQMTLASIDPDIVFGNNNIDGIDGAPIAAPVKMGSTSDPIRVTFRPSGQAVNYGTAYLVPIRDQGSENRNLRAVSINAAGKVTVWRYSPSGFPGPWMEML